MKARFVFIVMATVLSALLFCSCEQEADHATLRVNLRQDRSIVPADFPLEIDSYRIIGDGPGSESFNVETSKETISLEGLVIGEWTIEAEGLNANNDVLVTGSTTHRLSAANGSCTIILEDLVGTGSLEISLNWDPERISGEASIELELTPQYGERETETLVLTSFDENSGSAEYTGSGYPAGSYVLSARLYDGNVQVAGFVEAVRIAGDQVSKGEIEFDLDKYPIEPGTLELVNKTGVPVSCTIEGLQDSVEAGKEITVSITSETDEVDSFAIIWYLDGNYLGEGVEISLKPEAGTHRLDVVASTSRLGTSGSTSINFEAVSATEPGVPVLGKLVESNEDITLSGSAVVRFLPDGNAMIVSNAEEKVYIASMIRSLLNIEMEYTFTDLGITGEVVDFASEEISSTLTKVLLAQEAPVLAIVFNYNPQTATLTHYSSGTPVGYGYQSEIGVAEINSVGIIGDLKVDGCSVGMISVKHDDATGYWQNNYVSLTEKTGADDYFRKGSFLTMTGAEPIAGRMLTTDTSFFQIQTNGKGLLLKKTAEVDILKRASYFYPDSIFPENASDFTSLTTTAMIGQDIMLLLGENKIILEYDMKYSDDFGFRIHGITPMDHEAVGAIASKDYKYAYYIDRSTDEIVTLEISPNSTEVTEIGRTGLEDPGIDELAISDSGINLIAYDADNTDSLMIFRTTR